MKQTPTALKKEKQTEHVRDVSMGDIEKGKANFNSTQTTYTMFGETLMLNTQQRIILDLPTTLADFFEYLQSCDELSVIQDDEAKGNANYKPQKIEGKVSEILLKYCTVHDIMRLRMVCKSTAQIATPQIQMQAIQAGNLDESIRINYWVTKTPFFEVVNELKRSYPP